MENTKIDLLTKKLENVPQNVLERVLGYVDALIQTNDEIKPYKLSNKQQQILENQLDYDKSNYVDAQILFKNLKEKYVL